MPVKTGYAIADIATLKALPTVDLITGYARFVTGVNSWFTYNSTSTATSDDVTILLPSSGVGRWVKQKAWVTISDVIGIGSLASLSSVDLSGSNATGVLAAARFPALTGAITTSAGSLTTTLANNAVTTSKIADSNVTLPKIVSQANNTLLGNNSGGSSSPSALNPTQVKTLLAIDGSTDISWTSPLSVSNGGTGQTTLSGFFNLISPITSLGDLIYGSSTNTASRLAGNTSTAIQFLSQTGNGTISAAPVWKTLVISDISDLGVFSYTANGLVPFPGGSGTTRFLREDGSWVVPSGGSSGSPITVKDEGSNLTTALASLNFVGGGVIASSVGADVVITIPNSTGLINTSIKTSNYNANTNERILCDTRVGTFTVFLPSTPNDGDIIGFLDYYDSFGRYNLILNGNTKTIEGKSTYNLYMNGTIAVIAYVASVTNWMFVTTDSKISGVNAAINLYNYSNLI